ncbi:MAG: PTS sugar transporter subunit IIC, partial [Staphylococcus epidermidis]|nr:PTS sugar transporter subunit IIC [Staphylococcus epidermidis]
MLNKIPLTKDAPVHVNAPIAIGIPVKPNKLVSTIELNGVFHVKFFQEIGDLAGSLSGIAVGILTCLKLEVSPVFAVIVGLVLHDSKLLPAFIAAYVVAFGIKFVEKKVPEGLDL